MEQNNFVDTLVARNVESNKVESNELSSPLFCVSLNSYVTFGLGIEDAQGRLYSKCSQCCPWKENLPIELQHVWKPDSNQKGVSKREREGHFILGLIFNCKPSCHGKQLKLLLQEIVVGTVISENRMPIPFRKSKRKYAQEKDPSIEFTKPKVIMCGRYFDVYFRGDTIRTTRSSTGFSIKTKYNLRNEDEIIKICHLDSETLTTLIQASSPLCNFHSSTETSLKWLLWKCPFLANESDASKLCFDFFLQDSLLCDAEWVEMLPIHLGQLASNQIMPIFSELLHYLEESYQWFAARLCYSLPSREFDAHQLKHLTKEGTSILFGITKFPKIFTETISQTPSLLTEISGVGDFLLIEQHFSYLSHITCLYLDFGVQIVEDLFPTFSNLVHLTIFDSDLTYFPSSICKLKQLESLSVCFTKIETIPPELCQLIFLKQLDLSFNALKDLPLTLCLLPVLEELDLRKNKIEQIPETFEYFLSLKKLYLNGNPLKSIPQWNKNIYIQIEKPKPKNKITKQ